MTKIFSRSDIEVETIIQHDNQLSNPLTLYLDFLTVGDMVGKMAGGVAMSNTDFHMPVHAFDVDLKDGATDLFADPEGVP